MGSADYQRFSRKLVKCTCLEYPIGFHSTKAAFQDQVQVRLARERPPPHLPIPGSPLPSREAAKHNDKEKASNKNNINGGPSAGGAKGDGQNSETGIGRRNMRPARGKPLPPLPKNDIKIILKPHKGLMLKEYLKTEIPQAIIRSTGSIIPGSGPNQRKITGEDFILRIREGTNIIIVSTPSLEVADVIRRITCMELRGKQHPFNVYVADPDDSYKGVVHGFPAHTESADLQQHLRVRTQGVTIERARMLGSSNTALLTFSGGTCVRTPRTYAGAADSKIHHHKDTNGGGARDPSVPEQTDCRQTREDDSPVSIAGAVGTEDQKGTGALVRVDGGGGPLSTPIEIQIVTRRHSEEQYPFEGPLRLQGFAAVEFATA
ncbi:hypothetical protein HPB49_004832 [Dermacentor silvarum]|uniref:Uncharacterized protein n=1 Tax=Dermacentor silvarum TaxID=543639 RepID=A0ACB8DV36_DERSI|nr:hypothetical protein HPB49_004832 [Dermacentor silvarum]